MNELLPKVGATFLTSFRGDRAIEASIPPTWEASSKPEQGKDFGFDQDFWLIKDSQIQGSFRLQVKASEVLTPSGEPGKQYFSIPLDIATCNLYMREGNPVLLAFVDLNGVDDERDASVYYVFVDESISQTFGPSGVSASDQNSLTVRVPLANKLHRKLDIDSLLLERFKKNAAAKALMRVASPGSLATMSGLSPDSLVRIERLGSDRASAVLTTVTESAEFPWVSSASGTNRSLLRESHDLLNSGRVTEAVLVQDRIEKNEANLSTDELAELRYQRGRVCYFRADNSGAAEQFGMARQLVPENPRYRAAWIESSVLQAQGENAKEILSALGAVATDATDNQTLFQLVRIRAILGDEAEVATLLGKMTGEEREKAELLSLSIAKRWAQVIEKAGGLVSSADKLTLRHFYLVLQLRASIYELLGARDYVPMYGAPEWDVSRARPVWQLAKDALFTSRDLNWPNNSELLLESLSFLAPMFGVDEEVLDALRDFARSRPERDDIHTTLARLELSNDSPDAALRHLEKVKSKSSADEGLIVMLHAQGGSPAKAAQLAAKLVESGDKDSIQYAPALVLGLLSSERLGLKELAKIIETAIQELPDCDALMGFKRFLSNVHDSPLSKSSAVADLVALYKSTGSPLVRDHLYMWLDLNQESHRVLANEIVAAIRVERHLNLVEAVRHCSCTEKTGDFQKLEALAREYLVQFPLESTFSYFLANALYAQGQTGAALGVLKECIDATGDSKILAAYAEISARCGRHAEAAQMVRAALAAGDTGRRNRFALLRMLFVLSEEERKESVGIAWQMGDWADQEDEDEEGSFLSCAMSTRNLDDGIDEERWIRFWQRAERFCAKFPESKYLRKFDMGETPSPDVLKQMLELSGNSQEQLAERAKLLRKFESGEFPSPLSYRIGIVGGADNVSELFERCVRSRWFEQETRLFVDLKGLPVGPRDFSECRPVFDLVTLLAISELELWPLVWRIWNGITVVKASIHELDRIAFDRSPGVGFVSAKTTLSILAENVYRVVQPGSALDLQTPFGLFELTQIGTLDSSLSLVSVDAVARAVVHAGGMSGFSLIDFLDFAKAKRFLSNTEMVLLRARLSSWNISGFGISGSEFAQAVLLEWNASGKAPDFPSQGGLTLQLVDGWVIRAGDASRYLGLLSEVVVQMIRQDGKCVPAVRGLVAHALRSFSMRRHKTAASKLSSQIVSLAVACALNEMTVEEGRILWSAIGPIYSDAAGAASDEQLAQSLGAGLAEQMNTGAGKQLGLVQQEKILEIVAALGEKGTQVNQWVIEAFLARANALSAAG